MKDENEVSPERALKQVADQVLQEYDAYGRVVPFDDVMAKVNAAYGHTSLPANEVRSIVMGYALKHGFNLDIEDP